MQTFSRWPAILSLAIAMVPFLGDLHLPFDRADSGVAYARGGGGGGGRGGSHGGGGRDGFEGAGRAGNAVSQAATSTAHAGKAAAREAGFRNLGQAVSSAVHEAQRDRSRNRERGVETRNQAREAGGRGVR